MSTVNLEALRRGLLSTPMYVTDELLWLTDEGWDLYHQRSTTSILHSNESEIITQACNAIKHELPEKIVLIDVAAGDVNTKSLTMLKSLLKDSTERSICYIPIDLSENVKNWKNHLDRVPAIGNQVIDVVPIVGDAEYVFSQIDGFLPDTCREWPVVFTYFGPGGMMHDFYHKAIDEVSKYIIKRGTGWYITTYLELTEKTQDLVTEHYLNKTDIQGLQRTILLGFNQVSGAGLDLSAFEYRTSFADKFTTEGVDGFWSGSVYYAQANRDVTLKSAKLDLELIIKKDDVIRLCEGQLKSGYHEEKYMRSLGESKGFMIEGKWTDKFGMISCIVFRM